MSTTARILFFVAKLSRITNRPPEGACVYSDMVLEKVNTTLRRTVGRRLRRLRVVAGLRNNFELTESIERHQSILIDSFELDRIERGDRECPQIIAEVLAGYYHVSVASILQPARQNFSKSSRH